MSQPSDAFAGTRPLDPDKRLDETRLTPWLEANIEGFDGLVEVRQFNGGNSNPTYVVFTPTTKYVMRRKPPGVLLPSAHAVDREFRVMNALGKTGFPVPRVHALCADESVIGTMFYVMDMVDGRVLWDLKLPEMSKDDRTRVYEDQVATLARLHEVDYAAVGLADYGAPGAYFERQMGRWTKQYRAAEDQANPAMDRLIADLAAAVPADGRTSLVHGDFRLDNMALHPTEPKVAAVFDWELSTLGDPLADIAYYLMHWVMPEGERATLIGADLKALGIPSLEEMAARYCALTGRAGIEGLDWSLAYNLFRLAAIRQGIAARVKQGNASNPRAASAAASIEPLAQRALAVLHDGFA